MSQDMTPVAMEIDEIIEEEHITVSVVGVAGTTHTTTMPRTQRIWDVMSEVKRQTQVNHRKQSLLLDTQPLLPTTTLAALLEENAAQLELTLVITKRRQRCDFCGERHVRKYCGSCLLAMYCDSHCQRSAWRQHKQVCAKTVEYAATCRCQSMRPSPPSMSPDEMEDKSFWKDSKHP